ncbi:DUF185-domain-containing protein [Stereum hirsutum FP-91666 SS1]|uniref:DUF185-domain-containing protein n=1 Tax=Stereum hirsutum (strain FP-91666) TaxID=721885 RepID=UPI000440E91F|nr:DUF185-domain-containing protein [Stereum hirsutum FP-91666 SS1]EIM90675.1 DUF185-domain-containing protein [Stereum hirsutum FP-91666 SS1]
MNRRVDPSPSGVTPVEKIILDTIKANGPISFATYINLCLSHPTHGYYMNPSNAVFGAQGDFITSPEISQVFGELVGVWLLSQYLASGMGRKIRLVELGPGRGTLMDDILRTLSQFPASRSLLKQVHLVETSSALRVIQEQKLERWSKPSPQSNTHTVNISWHDSIDDIPSTEGEVEENVYTMLVAHEFFDALPVHLLEKTSQGWKEVLLTSLSDPVAQTRTVLRPSDLNLDLDTTRSSLTSTTPSSVSTLSASSTPITGESTTSGSKPRLRPVLSPEPSPVSTLLGSSSPRFASLPIGSRIEVCAAGFQVARKLAGLAGGVVPASSAAAAGDSVGKVDGGGKRGCGLIVDYGDEKVFGASFRAFKDHKIVDPLLTPGQCDLTANVDFAYLKEAMKGTGVRTLGSITQSTFLTRMGLDIRLNALKQRAPKERADVIEGAAKRLVDKMGMGKEYRVLGIVADGLGGGEKEGSDGGGGEGEGEGAVWPFVGGEDV